jgi:hypothetical protein
MRQRARGRLAYASSITVGSVWKRRAPAEGGGTAVGRLRPWAGSPSPAEKKRRSFTTHPAGEVLTRQGERQDRTTDKTSLGSQPARKRCVASIASILPHAGAADGQTRCVVNLSWRPVPPTCCSLHSRRTTRTSRSTQRCSSSPHPSSSQKPLRAHPSVSAKWPSTCLGIMGCGNSCYAASSLRGPFAAWTWPIWPPTPSKVSAPPLPIAPRPAY